MCHAARSLFAKNEKSAGRRIRGISAYAELLLWGVFTLNSAIVFVGVVLFTAFSVLGDLLAWVFSLVFGILDPLPIGSVVAFTISDINRKEAIAKAVGALLYLDALFLAVLD